MLLAKANVAAAERVFVYTYNRKENRTFEVDGVIVRSFYVPAWTINRNPFYVPRDLQHIIENNTDELDALVITGAFIPENAPIARLARRAYLPYVLYPNDAFNPRTFDGFRGFRKGLYERLFERSLVDNAALIRLLSPAQIQHFETRGYSVKDRHFIVKEGIDTESLGVVHDLPNRQHHAEPQFGFLGRLDIYQKGLDILLEGWAQYKRAGGTGQLTLVGPAQAAERAQLDSLMAQFDAPDVALLEPRYGADKYAYLNSLSVLVHPSRHEGIPRTLRETLALGCPIITTIDTNLSDLLEACNAGYTVALDPDAIASALHSYAALSAAARTQLDAGALQAATQLNWPDLGQQYVAALEARFA